MKTFIFGNQVPACIYKCMKSYVLLNIYYLLNKYNLKKDFHSGIRWDRKENITFYFVFNIKINETVNEPVSLHQN